ncbi:MAG: hypothetical protein EOP45_11605 [Sphingobacteriaceae bacterium]|nr:MAG: hypothetical protein EOP45_11605 [Sphingobacteriaceae bacterium]
MRFQSLDSSINIVEIAPSFDITNQGQSSAYLESVRYMIIVVDRWGKRIIASCENTDRDDYNNKLIEVNKSIKVKASDNTDGEVAKTADDAKYIKLYLTTSNTNPLLAANVKFSTSTALQYKNSYTFSNVPAGTYYVAVELFSDSAGLENIIEPIAYDSNNDGDTAYNLTDGKRGVTVSSNYATVANDFSVTFDSSDKFLLSPKLLDTKGAKIITSIIVEDGVDTNVGNISSSVESVVD